LIKNSQPFGKKCEKTTGFFLTRTVVMKVKSQLTELLYGVMTVLSRPAMPTSIHCWTETDQLDIDSTDTGIGEYQLI